MMAIQLTFRSGNSLEKLRIILALGTESDGDGELDAGGLVVDLLASTWPAV